MKANPGKFQFMILRPSDGECFILETNVIEIRKTNEAELLGLTIDHKLKSDAHVDNYVKQQSLKFSLSSLHYAESENTSTGKVISKFVK